jgi:hypothetical protein
MDPFESILVGLEKSLEKLDTYQSREEIIRLTRAPEHSVRWTTALLARMRILSAAVIPLTKRWITTLILMFGSSMLTSILRGK